MYDPHQKPAFAPQCLTWCAFQWQQACKCATQSCALQVGCAVDATPVQEADKLMQHASTIGHMAAELLPLAKLHAELSKKQ